MQKRKEISSEATEDEAEDEEIRRIDEGRSEEEHTKVQKININHEKGEANENEQETGKIGQCAICHISINDANLGGSVADSEDPRWSKSYLLCQCCVRNFTIRTG